MKKPYSLIKRAAWLLLPFCMSLSYTAQGSNIFLEFPNSSIQGESQDIKYKDQIIVEAFSEGMTNTFAGDYRNGTGGGKTNRNALAVTKNVDRSSPALREALLKGNVLEEATLTVSRINNRDRFAYFVIRIKDVVVTKVSMSASDGDNILTEQVELTFAKITWTYISTDNEGMPGDKQKAGWDFENNQSYDR
jgi:type VI secretion system Hcp family effector